jgi:3-phytase/alkaline phosphatase D
MLQHRHSIAALALSCAILATPQTGLQAAELPNGIASGDVTATGVVLWARPAVAGAVTFTVRPAGRPLAPAISRRIVVDNPDIPAKVVLRGLKPGTRYRIEGKDTAGNRSVGSFRTLADACTTAPVRFGVTGDTRGELAPFPSISNVRARKLDFLVNLGDTIYAERYSGPTQPTATTLADYRARHREIVTARFGSNVWADVRANTPLFAMIDDHEVINDFAGGAPPASDTRFDNTGRFINETNRYKAGLQAFVEAMPIQSRTWRGRGAVFDGKPQLFRNRDLGRLAMFAMVDARSFRDAPLPSVTDLTSPTAIGTFLATSLGNVNRTLLGLTQFARLQAALLDAETRGVAWKFVFLPEPAQNLGVLFAADRYEGYAAERNALLAFIKEKGIKNVVFVTADLHGTLVNNLTYQTAVGGPQIPVDAWEIVTGAVAFEEPFGQTVAQLGAGAGLITAPQKQFYDSLPVAPDNDQVVNDKDAFIESVINGQLTALGYDTLGLAGSGIPATLLQGGYQVMHSYGWTEFRIDPATKDLTVTTWGVPAYTYADIKADPDAVKARVPAALSKFKVAAVGSYGACAP